MLQEISSKTYDGQRIQEILDLLEQEYGVAQYVRRFEPVDELISCILSQHTSDSNSFPAFYKLRQTFPTWQEVVDAGQERVANVIHSAGIANQKAKNIIACLKKVKDLCGAYNIDFLSGLLVNDAKKWLLALPGVGPKTAAIVLCFSFNMAVIPVDTHIYRVSKRLGLIPDKMSAEKAHEHLLEIVPKELTYGYHVTLIQHGRKICKAQKPRCNMCPLCHMCPWHEKQVKLLAE